MEAEQLPTYLFADYIGGLAGKEEELDFLGIAWIRLLQPLAWKLISAEKTKLMTNNANVISIDIKINSEKLDEVGSFKYLGAVFTDQESQSEVLSRVAQTTAALARLKTI